MNPQDPQQYGQTAYTPQNSPQTVQPDQADVTLPAQAVPHVANSGAPNDNPYEFILNPKESHHKSSIGDTMLKRLLVIVGLLVTLTVVGAVVAKLLLPADTTPQQITAIAQEQQEIVRVATFITSHATSVELVNFATNTQMSVGTNQQAAVDYLANRDIKLEDEELALKQDAATDKLFTAALSANTFDSTAVQTLNNKLSAYQASLKKAYTITTSKKARAVIQASYDTAVALAAQGKGVSVTK